MLSRLQRVELIERLAHCLRHSMEYRLREKLAEQHVKAGVDAVDLQDFDKCLDFLDEFPDDELVKLRRVLRVEFDPFVDRGEAPTCWRETDDWRVFISHHSAEERYARRLNAALKPLGFAGFVAGHSIDENTLWAEQVMRALATMHAFIAVWTQEYSLSVWSMQEVGFAAARDVPVVSIMRDHVRPRGMVASRQALNDSQGKSFEELANSVVEIFRKSP